MVQATDRDISQYKRIFESSNYCNTTDNQRSIILIYMNLAARDGIILLVFQALVFFWKVYVLM